MLALLFTLVVLAASASFAAAAGGQRLLPAERCAALQQQFSDALAANPLAIRRAGAEKQAGAGARLCDIKKYSPGERRLVRALSLLGVKVEIPMPASIAPEAVPQKALQ
jgi:hypothetical protein